MDKMRRSIERLNSDSEIAASAIRQIAEKSRFGVFVYLIGFVSIFLIAPNLQIESLPFVLLLAGFLILMLLREFAYRLAQRTDSRFQWTRYCLHASYLSNAVVWSIFSLVVFQSERALSGATAATIITTAGLTAGGVTAIVPDFALIRKYSILMMGATAIMLPLLISDIAIWYVAPLCLIYAGFILSMGRQQSKTAWQLMEGNQNLRRQAEALSAAELEAVAGARAKSEFLANMSHEIRTPMNGVIGVAQLLETTPLNEQQKTYLKIIQDAGNTLLTIIDDILDFSKLDAEKMSLVLEPVNLDSLVRNLQTLFAIQLRNTQVQLRYEHGADLPDWVLADPARLRQLLYNLIGNAIKFTREGSVVVKLELKSAATPDICRVRFSVSDTGVGIAEKDWPQVFAKFKQIGSSISTKGTGLGLAICKHLIALMGGEIGFDSKLNMGSCFWFELPLQIAPPAEAESNTALLTPIEQRGGDVLLVEDNKANQIVARGMLEYCGYNVHIASSGEEAIGLARQKEFGIILMDCDMPGIDGLTATQIIRDWEIQQQRLHTPIIALTAHVLEGARQRCRDAGMNDFLAKPLSLDKLAAMMRRWTVVESRVADTDIPTRPTEVPKGAAI